MKIFYDEFFSYIIQELKSKRNIAGEIALKEFVELNPELFDFDGIIDNFSSEEDALSYLVKQHLDSFQEWLIKDKHEEISVNLARFRWRMKGGEQTALKPDLVELGIDVDEYKLIDINEVEIDREVVSKLEILYEKIKLRSDKYACYKCARKIARFYERNSTNNKLISDKYLIVAEINRRYETIKSSTYYELAAMYLAKESLHEDAAKSFYRSRKIACENNEGLDRELSLTRSLRKQYECLHSDKEASKEFIYESDLLTAKSKSKSKLDWCWRKMYKLFSNYGESPIYVAIWAAVVIVLSAVFYATTGLEFPKDRGYGAYSYLYFSLVSFTSLGYGDITSVTDFGRLFSALESLLGVILISLFMVTVVRKYSR